MVEDRLDAVGVGVAEEDAARLTPDLREALAAFSHGGRVDDGQHLLDVARDERVEERFIDVLEVAHEGVAGEVVGKRPEGLHAASHLLVERANLRRKQAVEREFVALRLGEGGALVEDGSLQQAKTRE